MKGTVEVMVQREDGELLVFERIHSGSCFNIANCIQEFESLFTFRASKECEIFYLNREDFLEIAKVHEELQ